MYEAAVPHPAGESTVARHALTAARYGFEGVVVRGPPAEEPTGAGAERTADEVGVDVVPGVELAPADRSSFGGVVGAHREGTVVLVVRTDSPGVARAAVEDPRVDVLSPPLDGDVEFDDVLARKAAENGVAIEFDLGPALRSAGGRRVRALSELRKRRELVDHYDAPFVASARPLSHLELRAPRELLAVGDRVGVEPDRAREGFRRWGGIAARNRKRHSESFISEGVELGPYEEEP